MNNDVEYLFMCLLAICISSWEKYLLIFFTHFLIVLFAVLSLSCNCSLRILDHTPSSHMLFENICGSINPFINM